MFYQRASIRLFLICLKSVLIVECMKLLKFDNDHHPLSTLAKTKQDFHRRTQVASSFLASSLFTTYSYPRSVLATDKQRHISLTTSVFAPNVVITDLLFVRHAESFNNIIFDSLMNEKSEFISSEELVRKRRKLRQADCSLSKRGFQQVNLLQAFAQQGGIHQAVGIKSKVNSINNNYGNGKTGAGSANTNILTVNDNPANDNSLSNWMIVSSPMKRCLLTSQALSAGLAKPVYVHPLLYEAGGCYDVQEDGGTLGLPGSTASEIEKEFMNYKCLPGMENGWYRDRSATNSVETSDEFQARVDKIVNWIWSIHEDNNIRHATQAKATLDDYRGEYKYKKNRLFKSSNLHASHTAAVSDSEVGLNDVNKSKNMVVVCHGLLLSAILTKLQGGTGLITHYNTGYSHVQLVSPFTATSSGNAVSTSDKSITDNDVRSDPGDKANNNSLRGVVATASSSSNPSCVAALPDNGDANIGAYSPSSSSSSSSSTTRQRFSTIKYINKCDHINAQTQYDLMTGADSWNDNWIQEYQKYKQQGITAV